MQKILFIDRDGTLIHEPADDWQVDSWEKFIFIPGVMTWLGRIARELDYKLVMVTNQDGLGTPAWPEEKFWPIQDKMIRIFENEGITFEDVFIDRSYKHQQLPTRKPGTGMLGKYLKGDYDLAQSFVIGDRVTDVQLADNLGCKAIFFNATEQLPEELRSTVMLETDSWKEVYELLVLLPRKVLLKRHTLETQIEVQFSPDGSGLASVETGIGFFDHMLVQIARHGNCDLFIQARGDLHIDNHHTIEDVGIAMGRALREAAGRKTGLQRYGFALPMDEAEAKVLIDFSGRSYFVWKVECAENQVAGISFLMWEHFFRSLADQAAINLHIEAKGRDGHHTIEAVFKAFARALRMAFFRDITSFTLPSTKGEL
ncbi:MAG TPA: bifunctional histidinol-phosphatase/imidazoleglycerol-phosphate dehydratase HisB [Bacteroidales bacterium]|nr:bifunctional histidinol-phosphatase/imidazoleglycerol-phosphate dehydratase HisB [Bacteroidales bacterium]